MESPPRPAASDKEPHSARPPRSSRLRYLNFVRDYKRGHLFDDEDDNKTERPSEPGQAKSRPPLLELLGLRRGKRRDHLHAYLNWLWPHRLAIGSLFAFAVVAAGLLDAHRPHQGRRAPVAPVRAGRSECVRSPPGGRATMRPMRSPGSWT